MKEAPQKQWNSHTFLKAEDSIDILPGTINCFAEEEESATVHFPDRLSDIFALSGVYHSAWPGLTVLLQVWLCFIMLSPWCSTDKGILLMWEQPSKSRARCTNSLSVGRLLTMRNDLGQMQSLWDSRCLSTYSLVISSSTDDLLHAVFIFKIVGARWLLWRQPAYG